MEQQELIETSNPSSRSSDSQTADARFGNRRNNLPKINLPSFSGDYHSWRFFYDLFTSMVGENHDLSNVEKMHYLKTCLTGDAARLVTNLKITDNTFGIAWRTLVSPYENKRVLISAQLDKLFSLRPIKSKSAQDLNALIATVSESLGALKALNCHTSSWNPLLIHQLARLLDEDTHEAWELKIGPSISYPTLKEFEEFVFGHTLAWESLASRSVKPTKEKGRFSWPSNKSETKFRSMVATAPITKGGVECRLCKSAHYLFDCPSYSSLPVERRKRTITKLNLCFNCLGNHAANFPSSHCCKKCGSKHHTTLHDNQMTGTVIHWPYRTSEIKLHSLWWHRPSWLSLEPINWPHLHPITPAKIDLEKNPKRAFISHQVSQTPPWDLIERYSSLTKLIRITAICKHVVTWFRQSLKESNNGSLTTLELQESCQFYIRQIQKSSFQQEIKLLTRGERLSKSNPLIKLTPFIDKVGLLRVGGRLQHANLEADVEHPFTLPRQSRFTTLVVADAHLRTMHGRTQVTLAYIRQKYWIIGGRAPVRSFILRCVKCLRYRQSRAQQLMDQLLELKVTPSRPFLHSGVDYAGPISIKTWRGRAAKTYKGYLVIFVCFSTSAVHIEIVTDYTTEAFISAYKRFTARRGICATLHSDCGVASNIATSNLKAQHWKVRHAENNIDCAHKRTGEGSQLRHLNASVE
ncbi:hypothetical protein ALC57_13157 [Trachymyrmex cornetzi]|uniref:Integrase zinc-binding domain-containing protein n=1 Tax=Trachymyrmex cornetzi TaxID=471704 RepID=A0A151J098_9HYME|nr:hypothetical protein ALC57_13157 [Trachymyrmex cornetzi]